LRYYILILITVGNTFLSPYTLVSISRTTTMHGLSRLEIIISVRRRLRTIPMLKTTTTSLIISISLRSSGLMRKRLLRS
jgi:hypothetical protein